MAIHKTRKERIKQDVDLDRGTPEYHDGRQAYKDGFSIDANPYKKGFSWDASPRRRWITGWLDQRTCESLKELFAQFGVSYP